MIKIFITLIVTLQFFGFNAISAEESSQNNTFLCKGGGGSTEYIFNFEDLKVTTYVNDELLEFFDVQEEKDFYFVDENIVRIDYPSSVYETLDLNSGRVLTSYGGDKLCLQIEFLYRCDDFYHYFGLLDSSLTYSYRYIPTSKEISFMPFQYSEDGTKAVVSWPDYNSITMYDINTLEETYISDGVLSDDVKSCKQVDY